MVKTIVYRTHCIYCSHLQEGCQYFWWMIRGLSTFKSISQIFSSSSPKVSGSTLIRKVQSAAGGIFALVLVCEICALAPQRQWNETVNTGKCSAVKIEIKTHSAAPVCSNEGCTMYYSVQYMLAFLRVKFQTLTDKT